MKSNKGFSLVELIVVIAIMAIIAGVAIPVYSNYIEKANEGVDENAWAEAVHAAELAAMDEDYKSATITIEVATIESKKYIKISSNDTNAAAAEAVAGVVNATAKTVDSATFYVIELESKNFTEATKTIKGYAVA